MTEQAKKPEFHNATWRRWLDENHWRRGWTQAEAARRCGMQRDIYGKYLKGYAQPTDRKLMQLAAGYRVNPGEIDPDRAHLDMHMPDLFDDVSIRLEEPVSGNTKRANLFIDGEMDVALAMKVIELLEKAGVNRRE